ncbi:preprotein translocase subunit SecA [Clostridium sp. C45]|uniref:preprotein translocase subunit SecA n=1 Tax=Clostridium sp. 10cd* TaxID=3373596 RepID=UPI0037BFC7B2
MEEKTQEYKHRYEEGETLDSLLIEAFATSREAARRTIGEYPYKVQIMGAVAMHQGDIAEMKTGEGKTLTSTMCVYLNALSGKGVHVVTVNDYLAGRDAEWMGQIYRFLGLSVGVNSRPLTPSQKRDAFNCDITYTTNSELGFDYLRDNMVTDVKDRVLRGLHVAIVDEVDSILVDESRTPLIISGGAKKTANLYLQADAFAKRLKGDDFEIDEKTRQIMLSEKGVSVAERYFKIKNLYDVDHTQLVHHITQALKANYIMKNEVEYVVQDDEIVIVDQFTGRTMPGRAYSDGLHQAIEAKEGVSIKEETSTLATITYQNFFRLYDKLAGMTGTAKTEEEEFLDIYNMRVIEIPTNRPVQRIDYPDAIFANPRLKFAALVKEVKELYEKGQPVLVGTISVETSELVHELLRKERIPHEVLNAKNHAREAEIIAKAGRPKSVTIATNMAGRGTDIKLTDESRALGGLVVLGSERHESRRIDNQLRGRSGRQGDPGYSRFYVSLKDELMIRFGGDKFEKLFESMGDAQIESKMVTKSISQAQKRVEGYNYDVRKQLLDYDDVLRKQREIMYEQRNFVLENEDVHGIVRDMIDRVIDSVVDANVDHTRHDESVDYAGVLQGLELLGLEEKDNLKLEEIQGKEKNDVTTYCAEKIFTLYDDKIKDIRDEFKQFEKTIVLRNMDRNWIEHIDMMDKLRNGIHLRSYAQNNPLQAYIQEGYEMFEEMQARIAREVVFFALKVQVERKVEN